jgi:hypothetical protein
MEPEKIRYRIYMCPPLLHIMSQIDPIHAPIPLPEDPS